MRMHILGASGAGTTTLGKALAMRVGCAHLDTDEFFWMPTQPPFQTVRERGERQAMLGAALQRHSDWVLSGSLCGWGDMFIPLFERVVFLWIPREIRLARLRERERARFGAAIMPGGPQHAAHEAFMAWAVRYDDGVDVAERSRAMHERWLAALPCRVERITDTGSVEDHVSTIMGGSR
jgi:adenylate kinase family enzyme